MDILYFVLGISGASTIIIWLGKLIITRAADASIEKYKSELVKDIEKHKAELSKITIEHQVRFSKLHEERGEKIKSLYNKVIDLEKALNYSTTVAQGGEFINDHERENDSIRKITDLSDSMDRERIFFSISTVAKFDNIIKESWEITRTMRKVRNAGAEREKLIKLSRQVPEIYLKHLDGWDEAYQRTQNEFSKLKEDLSNEFRALLGINN